MIRTGRSSFWLRMAPATLYCIVVVVCPFVVLAWQSFHELDLFTQTREFVGWANYVELARDESYIDSAKISFYYATAATIASVGLGLCIARWLYRRRSARLAIPLLALPFFVPPAAIAVAAAHAVDGQFGIVPHLLAWLNVSHPDNIMGQPFRAFLVVVTCDVWQWSGILAIAFFLRMRRIPRQLFDVAACCGMPHFHRIVNIWIPAMIPTVFTVFLFKFVWTIGDSERVSILTGGGGPHGALRVFGIWIERVYFRFADIGLGAAGAMVFYLATLAGVTLLSWSASRSSRATE